MLKAMVAFTVTCTWSNVELSDSSPMLIVSSDLLQRSVSIVSWICAVRCGLRRCPPLPILSVASRIITVMHQHAGLADGVQLQSTDLQIVYLHPLDANGQADDRGADAGAGQELVAQPQPAGLGPAAVRGHG